MGTREICGASRGWTQEEAAERAGYSDRLIRKAESGGALEIQTVAILAELYSTDHRKLTPRDLLAEPLLQSDERSSTCEAKAAAMVRRYFEDVWNQQRLEAIDELASPDCVIHAEGNAYRGRAALQSRAVAVHTAFSDIRIEIEAMTVHQDVVICRWHAAFTRTGPFFGIPPTGKRHAARASTWIRFEGDWLVEGWDYGDRPLLEIVREG